MARTKNVVIRYLTQILWKILSWLQKGFNSIAGGFRHLKGNQEENLNNKPEKKDKGITDLPGPTSLPFFGTTFSNCQINPLDLRKSNEENFRKYGPIFKHEYFWNIPIIAISEPEDIETVYKSSDLRPPVQIIETYRVLNKKKYHTVGLVNLNGEEWQRMRKETTQHILNTKFMNSMISGLNEIADDFSSSIKQKGPTHLNAADFIFSNAVEGIFYMFLGSRVGFTGREKIPEHLLEFITYSGKYFEAFSKSSLGFPWWQYMPTKVWTDFVTAEDTLYSLVQRITEDAKSDSSKVPGLLQLWEKQNQNLSKLEMQTVSLEFIMGATDPVLQTLILSLYWISKHENVQKKLHEELRSVLPNKNSAIDDECLRKLVYLQACMMESFRFCPSTPNVARITSTNLKIQDYHLPAYTVVICQSWHSYMEEKNFYRANEFIPERWLLNSTGEPTFKPHRPNIVRLFGGGKRICPGNKYAMMLLKILLAKLFRNFNIKFLQDLDIKYVFLVAAVNSVDIEFTACEQ